MPIRRKEYLNGCFDPIDVPESCPTIVRKPENVQKELWEAFETAVVKAQKQGIPAEEIFQFLEDVIDNRAADQALKEMEQTGEKPIPWEEVKKEAGL